MVSVLLEVLHADPADEAAWLALADALEEAGQPDRAALTRLGRRLRGLPDGPERESAQRRAQDLLRSGVRPCRPLRTNSLGMTFALIPAGTFWMGSPEEEEGHQDNEAPLHEVEISRPFYLGVTPVTQEQYERVMGLNPSSHAPTGNAHKTVPGLDTRSFPVEWLSWRDARAFCRALTKRPEERRADRRYRLPTEAQWEYACRAWTRTPFHFGPSASAHLANFDGPPPYGRAPEGPRVPRTWPVGLDVPNLFGLHDLHANVRQWCADWYAKGYYARSSRTDPPGPPRGSCRVLRGGDCGICGDRGFFASHYRAAYRAWNAPYVLDSAHGIRLLMLFG
jgi:uncharacterized protein (TIGR02996 family)